LREFDHEIAELQGRVAVISFASPDHLKGFAERFGHPYRWLADPKRPSYRRFGIGRRGLFTVAPPRAI
jgi:peroxiredoxin